MARVAFILDELFEDVEFSVPYERVRRAGHEAVIVGCEAPQELKGKKGGMTVRTEVAISDVASQDFQALVIPGGYSPDRLRLDPCVVAFTLEMYDGGKPVAAICHGPSLLAECAIAHGRTLTSWPSIKTDLVNAGAHWIDRDVVEDGHLITSRMPEDLTAFTDALLRQLAGDIPGRIDISGRVA
jgi:protease I